MGCNLGIGKVCLSTHDPVGRIIGARTHGRQMNFSVELCHNRKNKDKLPFSYIETFRLESEIVNDV